MTLFRWMEILAAVAVVAFTGAALLHCWRVCRRAETSSPVPPPPPRPWRPCPRCGSSYVRPFELSSVQARAIDPRGRIECLACDHIYLAEEPPPC